MKKILITLFTVSIIITACTPTLDSNESTAKSIYTQALENTNQLDVVKHSISSNVNDIDTKGEAIADNKQNKFYFKSSDEHSISEFLYDNGNIYIYEPSLDKYITINEDDPIGKYMSMTLQTSTDTTIKRYQDKILNSLRDEDFSLTTLDYDLNNETIKNAKQIEFIIPTKVADDLYREITQDVLEATVDYQVEMMIQFDLELSEENQEQLSEDELEAKRKSYHSEMESEVNTILDDMHITDMRYKIIIDNNDIIRQTTETFKMELMGEATDYKTETELIAHGTQLSIPSIDESKVITYEESMNL